MLVVLVVIDGCLSNVATNVLVLVVVAVGSPPGQLFSDNVSAGGYWLLLLAAGCWMLAAKC